MNNRLDAEVSYLETKSKMISCEMEKLSARGIFSARDIAANSAMQHDEIAIFKQAVMNAVAEGESRDSAITRLKNELAAKHDGTLSAFTRSAPSQKGKQPKNKLHNPVVQTLLKMGESVEAGNKRLDAKLQEERKLDNKIEARRSAYLKDYYKLYDEN